VRRLRTLTVAFAALTCVAAGPAYARTDVHRDAKKDVAADGPTPGTVVGDRANKTVDITRLTVRHTDRTVELRLDLRALTPKVDEDPTWSVVWQVRAQGRRTPLDLLVLRLGRWDDVLLGGNLGKRCPRRKSPGPFAVTVSQARDSVGVTIPRTCLGNPKWVRVGAAVTGTGSDGETGAVDLSHRKGASASAMTVGLEPGFSLPKGKKVRRG
jgi:hypothetical protein